MLGALPRGRGGVTASRRTGSPAHRDQTAVLGVLHVGELDAVRPPARLGPRRARSRRRSARSRCPPRTVGLGGDGLAWRCPLEREGEVQERVGTAAVADAAARARRRGGGRGGTHGDSAASPLPSPGSDSAYQSGSGVEGADEAAKALDHLRRVADGAVEAVVVVAQQVALAGRLPGVGVRGVAVLEIARAWRSPRGPTTKAAAAAPKPRSLASLAGPKTASAPITRIGPRSASSRSRSALTSASSPAVRTGAHVEQAHRLRRVYVVGDDRPRPT